MSVGTLEELIDENHVIVSSSVGPEYYVSILSFVYKDQLEPGCAVLMHDKVKKHTSYLMTIEMSFVGSLCLLASTYKSPDGEAIKTYGLFHGWTAWTLIPVLFNAVGGILISLIMADDGGVRKIPVIFNAVGGILVGLIMADDGGVERVLSSFLHYL